METPTTDAYDRTTTQDTLTKDYMANMLAYIKITHPNISQDKARQAILSIIETNLKRPQLKIIEHPVYGTSKLNNVDLLNYCSESLNKKIITPAGSVYHHSDIKEAFIKGSIQRSIATRKIVKNEGIDLEAKGQVTKARIKGHIQSRIKIFVNAISGAMQSPYNCLYDPAGYNAITSVCRHGCMTGYAHTERFLEGNFYMPNEEAVINWVVQLVRVCPTAKAITDIVTTYKLVIPTSHEVADSFIECLKLSTRVTDTSTIYDLFSRLQEHERIFVYYAYNLKHIFQSNSEIFKRWMDYLFTNPNVEDINMESIDPTDIYKIDSDLVTMVTSINPNLLEGQLLYDTVTQCPRITRKFIVICRAMGAKIAELQDLFNIFLCPNVDVQYTNHHKNIMRKTVIVSDTDSVIFTTKNWVIWYVGKISYEPAAYQINAFIVYLLTKSLIHTFAVMSSNIGMTGSDLRLIAMKNEFLYPVLLRTPMGKHYAGIISIKEGRVLPSPKPDIKGKNFRGSDICETSLAFTKQLLLGIIADYMRDGSLSGNKIIYDILKFEKKIKDSIENQETTFLGTMPINPEENYKAPDSSSYFYYQLWQAVFAEKYDNLYLPQKCKVIPIDYAGIRSATFLNSLKVQDSKIYDKLVAFLRAYPNKQITRIFIPLHISMPKEIISLVEIPRIIHSNASPAYLILRSLGIGLLFKGQTITLSDIYQLRELAA